MSRALLGYWTQLLRQPSFREDAEQCGRSLDPTHTLYERLHHIGLSLLQAIQRTPAPCFLLPAVLEYIDLVNEHRWATPLHYQLASFESWLEEQSGLEAEQQLEVRGKIVGMYLPREAYQQFFPIGRGLFLTGSHIVTAHSSPDLDTTTASFWGWIDAFGAQVAQRLHHWNVPSGLPDLVEVRLFFQEAFGSALAELPRARSSLVLTAFDLLTRREMDAALDDANVERFTRLLERYLDKTQFLLITHNKRTMAVADLLIGVSMQEKGVSTVLSLDFAEEEAPQLELLQTTEV